MKGLGEHYERRRGELATELAALAEKSDVYSRWRGLTALPAGVLALTGWIRGLPTAGWAIVGLLVTAFVVLVVRHAFLATRVAELEQRRALVDAGLRRMAGQPEPDDASRRVVDDPHGQRFASGDHPYAADLDLFGPGSLFAAMSRAETAVGEETLARWLKTPASLEQIQARQLAVRELAQKPRFLEDLTVLARRAESRGRAEDPLALWGEAPRELPVPGVDRAEARARTWLVWLARITVPLTVVSFVFRGSLVPFHPWLALAYAVPLMGQLVALGGLLGPIRRMVTFVSSREAPFGRFRGVFSLAEEMEVEAPMLRRIRDALRGGEGAARASVEIARLERIVGFADLRHNGLVHFLVSVAFLYDVWVALALETWRVRSGRRARAWLAALGELEALASLAMYAAEHPDFAWPTIEAGPSRLEAKSVAHPLLDPTRRVASDVSLGGAHAALLITGSNMSGKSTYLRSMGLCAVMAQAGSVVCAREATLSPLSVWTSMRIQDSLAQGASHFYAELLRLKAVVEASREAGVLFLLDEILHGTNSRERTIGARGVVLDLIRRGAIGAVSTHDLALVRLADEAEGRVRIVHFSDHIEAGKMVFDYRMQEGVVRTTNAIRLMRLVGIDVAFDETAPASEPPAPVDA